MTRLRASRRATLLPAPLRRSIFRQLWLSMSASYAGDRLQSLAQGWLVATLTGSALAVGGIGILSALPLLLIPIGGVIADQVNRRRLLIAGQLVGALATALVAALVLSDQVAVWHIYAWALVNGAVTLVSRPAYKTVLTEAVPQQEVRVAVALNSMTETGALVLVGALGSLLLALLGLALAFMLNTLSYLIAAVVLWRLRELGAHAEQQQQQQPLSLRRVLAGLREGLAYLWRQPALLAPLLLTFLMLVTTGPALGLLAAIVHRRGGSIVSLGMLSAAMSAGAFLGAVFAARRDSGQDAPRAYALLGLLAAGALVLFILLPVGLASLLPLAVLGFVTFTQAVWNTSRVRELAASGFQSRLQALTSMAFTLGMPLGILWAGPALDLFGMPALLAGPLALAACCCLVLLRRRPAQRVA